MDGTLDGSPGSGVDLFVEAYEEAQARDGRADLAAYLPAPDHPLYLAVLCELVRVDLEYAWEGGRPRRLEEYLAEFPALRRDPERLRQAAFEECRLRRQAGEAPAPDEYERRFGITDLGRLSPRPVPEGRESEASGAAPASGLDESARPDHPPCHHGLTHVSASFASATSPREHAESVRTLREADPGTAERVAAALRALPEPGSDFAGFRLSNRSALLHLVEQDLSS